MRARRLLLPVVWACFAINLGCAGAAPEASKATTAPTAPSASVFVREPAGRALSAWPITGGFPFPKGMVHDASKLRLKLDGRLLPVQSRISSKWNDGSARWVLLDWRADLEAEQTFEARVEVGTAPAAAVSVRWQETAEAIDIDTGPLRFRVPKRRAGLIDDVRIDNQLLTTGPVTCFMTSSGKRNDCLPPASVRVVDGGPLRVRIEARGPYAQGFEYVTRIDAYAGQPFVRILQTFEQHSADAFIEVQQIAVEIPITIGSASTYRFGVERSPPITDVIPRSGVTLAQLENQGFQIESHPHAGHAAGWLDVRTAERSLGIAARYFWQQYPQSFALRPNGLLYNLWSPAGGVAKIGSGAAKTHEFVLYFAAKKSIDARVLEALAHPLLPYANPAWTAHTGALRNALVPDTEGKAFLKQLAEGYRRQAAFAERERWDDSGSATCTDDRPERPRSGFFGMLNWGDWNFPGYHDDTKGCDAWGNLEYDMAQVHALAFAASGEPRYADDMTAAARHFMDVDTIHFSAKQPNWVGMNHPKNPLHFTYELGGIDLGHTWTEGLLSYYLMSGDERALATARGIADHLVERMRRGQVKGNPRQWGWPQIALVAMYEATGDDAYRKAASDYARGAMAAHAPDNISGWKLGILAESLAYTDSVASDPAIHQWLSRYATAVTAYSSTADPRLMPALAYVGASMNKSEYTQAAVQAVQRLTFGKWAKPFTIAGRVGFSVLASKPLLAASASREAPASGPKPPLPRAKPTPSGKSEH